MFNINLFKIHFIFDISIHKNHIFIRTLIIDDPALMRDILNQPAFSGRLQNDVFMQMSHNFHGNKNIMLIFGQFIIKLIFFFLKAFFTPKEKIGNHKGDLHYDICAILDSERSTWKPWFQMK